MTKTTDLVLIGKIAGTHGVRGQLRVFPYSGDAGTLSAVKTILLQKSGVADETVSVTSVAGHGRKIIISLEEYGDINAVQHLVG